MTGASEIQLERDNANDEEAVIVKIHVPSGTKVEAGDPLFEVESSKATQEISAELGGIFLHAMVEGEKVPYGQIVARIVPPGTNDLSIPARKQPRVATVSSNKIRPRFSTAAAALASRNGLNETDFDTAFVTEARVLTKLSGASFAKPSTPPSPRPAFQSSVLPRKRDEISSLSAGAGNTMLSVLGAKLGPVDIAREPGSFFSGKILDLVTYEAARLMRKYPKLNAAYDDGKVTLHTAVNAGIAFDEGERLLVYGIQDADAKDLFTLRQEIEEALARYVERKLVAPELTRATFTITDLSAQNLDYVFPILPRGQSSIIGITRDGDGTFRIYVGFDHRVTEGLEIARFIDDLRSRLMSFASRSAVEYRCSFCDKATEDEVTSWRGLGLLKLIDAQGKEALACYSCWSRW